MIAKKKSLQNQRLENPSPIGDERNCKDNKQDTIKLVFIQLDGYEGTRNFRRRMFIMKKKILVSAVLALVLMMSFSVTAFASGYSLSNLATNALYTGNYKYGGTSLDVFRDDNTSATYSDGVARNYKSRVYCIIHNENGCSYLVQSSGQDNQKALYAGRNSNQYKWRYRGYNIGVDASVNLRGNWHLG